MIEVYDLIQLLKEYEINTDKILKKNSYIIDKGIYQEIQKSLDYLIKELKIMPAYIEKCPSIMYKNVKVIKNNYEFLKKTNITISNIETCLHVLNTESSQLIETYNYILKNYGVIYLNRTTSILSVPVSRIKEIEKYNLDKNIVMSASIAIRTIEEIQKIIEVCNKNKIEITGSVFNKTAEEIEKIIGVCNKNKIEITGSIFLKTAEEIEKIVEVCNKNKIEITGSIFLKTAEKIEKIVEVCNKNKIEITGSVFLKNAEELQASIEYIKENYGSEYLKPLIISKKVEHLKQVFEYLDSLGVLPIVINSASILTLTVDEIEERKEFIDSINESIVNEKGKFNSIFGLSKKRYKKKTEEINVNKR